MKIVVVMLNIVPTHVPTAFQRNTYHVAPHVRSELNMSKRPIQTVLVNPRPRQTQRQARLSMGGAIRQNRLANPNRIPSPELKLVDRLVTASVPPAGTWVAPVQISVVTIGGNVNNRVGRKVTYKKLLIRAEFHAIQGTPPVSDCRIRFLVVYDRQVNGTGPINIGAILDNDSFTSPMNLDNRDRFLIIADVELDQSVGRNNYSASMILNRKFSLESIYNLNNAGDIGDVNTGAFFISYCRNESLSLDPIASQVRTRMRFTDF